MRGPIPTVLVPVLRRCGIGVVVVMPPFSSGEEADDRVVAAVVRCFVVPVAPNMGHRIDGPSGMPDDDRSQPATPDHKTGAELQRFSRAPARSRDPTIASSEIRQPQQK